jgi:murein DD-endopeptidase MepM/ murein hydrolase activator NlpD
MRLRTRLLLVVTSALLLAVCGIGWSAAAPPRWPWPLSPAPSVVAGFEAPASDYGPGHRGIDLEASTGQVVRSSTTGVVTVAGSVAGRGVVVVRTGALRLTYEPVSAAVDVGDDVGTGDVLGRMQSTGSHCAPWTCLHVGLRDGDEYIDPLPWFGPLPVRLKPLGSDVAAAAGPEDRPRLARDDTGPHVTESNAQDPGPGRSSSRLITGGAVTVLAGAAAASAVAARRRGQARG